MDYGDCKSFITAVISLDSGGVLEFYEGNI